MRATQLAKNMVTKWGLSEKLGPLMYGEDENEGYLGRQGGGQAGGISGETAKLIDQEVRRIIDECYATAQQLLKDNRDKLDLMAQALMKYETIDADQIQDIMTGKPVREPKDWSSDDTAGPSATASPVAKEEPDDKRGDSIIGGPAGEH
jgi:cell division protease FtsH